MCLLTEPAVCVSLQGHDPTAWLQQMQGQPGGGMSSAVSDGLIFGDEAVSALRVAQVNAYEFHTSCI